MITINSLHNEKLKIITKLLQKSKFRREQELFVVDGWREIKEGLKMKLEIKELFYCLELAKKEVIDIKKEKITFVTKGIFQKISYKENPDGFLAIFKEKQRKIENIKLNSDPLVVVLEGVEKPGNIGAIIRTAYAVGVDLIIINNSQTDIYNPNIIRASEGKIFSIPIIILTQRETVDWLVKNSITTLGAVTQAKQNYFTSDFTQPLALVFGSENKGLSIDWLEKVDKKIKIPMQAGIDSLNVSVAAAVILFEVIRQRKF